jgi:hypothetical protein
MKNKTSIPRRCDTYGRAYAGSQRQIQTYVNETPELLQRGVSEAFVTPMSLEWVSPLRVDGYREYQDGRFLDALGLSKYRMELRRFWPKGGPVWDALARERTSGGVLLVEAKSHVPEVYGSGCGAVAERSITKIDQSCCATKGWLSVGEQHNWKGSLYQSANRLCHLYFFREILRVPAWLANIYFTDDPHSRTSQSTWQVGIAQVKVELGISAVPYCADVLLPALSL